MPTLNKHIWLANSLLNAGEQGLTLQELQRKWDNASINDNKDQLKRTTFNRWRNALQQTLGIWIDCNLSTNKYFIANPDIIQSNNLSHWLIDTYTTCNQLTNFIDLKDQILIDEIPSSQNYLTPLLEAIRENKVVTFTYQNFFGEDPHVVIFEPYCLKLSQKRWYTLGKVNKTKQLKTYALDRIQNLTITDKTYKIPKKFNAKTFFSEYYGAVTFDNINLEHVIIRAYYSHPNYLRSLPLHHSQKEVNSTDNYTDFQYTLRPTYDFIMDILKYHDLLEVISPQWLRDEIIQKINKMRDLYK